MDELPAGCYQRATALVTDRSGRLLVFDHVGRPSAGTQLPAGGIQPGEEPATAVHRELAEESGLTAAHLVRKLGACWTVAEAGKVPVGLEEQVHHAFHLHLDEPAPDAWEWDECDGGAVARHRFAFRWIDLDDAATALWPVQALWLTPLRMSLAHDLDLKRA